MYIELIEDFPCETKAELLKREGEFIREMDCINKHIAGRSKKQYVKDNAEKVKKYKQKWCEENKDRLKIDKRQNYEDNKAKYNAQSKANYQKNKEKQLASQAVKYTCGCGKTLTTGKKARHAKSQKHIKYLNS